MISRVLIWLFSQIMLVAHILSPFVTDTGRHGPGAPSHRRPAVDEPDATQDRRHRVSRARCAAVIDPDYRGAFRRDGNLSALPMLSA